MTKTNFIDIVVNRLENRKNCSAWDKGVTTYALDIFESKCYELDAVTFIVDLNDPNIARKFFLDGCTDWYEYNNSGNSLIDDVDIAKRVCTPSQLRRVDNGRLKPNICKTWIDVQTRALCQAYDRLYDIILSVVNH